MQERCRAIARPINILYQITLIVLLVAAATWLAGPAVAQAAKKPNISTPEALSVEDSFAYQCRLLHLSFMVQLPCLPPSAYQVHLCNHC